MLTSMEGGKWENMKNSIGEAWNISTQPLDYASAAYGTQNMPPSCEFPVFQSFCYEAMPEHWSKGIYKCARHKCMCTVNALSVILKILTSFWMSPKFRTSKDTDEHNIKTTYILIRLR